MPASPCSAEDAQWVIWNGSFGILDMVTIGRIDVDANARHAWLEEPYDMVGPFSLDELETSGRISFAACIVMSRQRWQEDQVALRRESHILRREAQARMAEEYARYQERTSRPSRQMDRVPDQHYRKSLNLPIDGDLEPSQIKAAFRRLAQKTHPDMGGSHEQFVQITVARDALLARVS